MALLRMSESPASRIAIVEHRKSFPQAVPISICSRLLSAYDALRSLRGFFAGRSLESAEDLVVGYMRSITAHAGKVVLYTSAAVPELCCIVESETYVVAGEMVDLSLGEHRVVYCNILSVFICVQCSGIDLTFELTLAERWGVAGDENELGSARTQLLEG